MKTAFTFILLLFFTYSNAQEVAFFGDAIFKSKIRALFYRFDEEPFAARKFIPVQTSFVYGKKFINGYRSEFKQSDLRKHRFIYFSNTLIISKDSILVNQNRINLTELFKLIDAKKSGDEPVDICNDLFLDDHFDKLINLNQPLTKEEEQYAGNYSFSSDITDGPNEIKLDSSKKYYSVNPDIINSPFFQNVQAGRWKLGEANYNPKMKAIKVYQIYRFNSLVGNKTKPSDVGSSFDIMISKDKLLYPAGPQAFKELKRK